MSKTNNMLMITAERLGINNDLLIKKAEEYLRVFQSKGSLKTLNDNAKTVLCLDLASTSFGTGFDKETALKLSGLKKSHYQNNLHTVEKILELDKPPTISELCVQLSCTVVKELAEKIYSSYKQADNKIKDLQHPQYVVASIYTACKAKNVKVQKSQFIVASHLKSSQWKELVKEFEKFTESLGIVSSKSQNKIKEESEDLVHSMESVVITTKKDKTEEEVEDYEIWKKRILEEAYAALMEQEKMDE